MLLTPKFSIEQTDTQILVTIIVPHIRVGSAEIIVDNCEFSFYCKPYLLKLTFPKQLVDEEDSYSAEYDPNKNNGTLVVKLSKKNAGEEFPDLDLLSKLLQVRKIDNLANSMNEIGEIEVLHSENFVDNETDPSDTMETSTTNESLSLLKLTKTYPYGFNNQYTSVLSNLRDFMVDMIEIVSPESYKPFQRRQQRILKENQDFDAYRYLGDLYGSAEDIYYQSSMSFQPFWCLQYEEYGKLKKPAKKSSTSDEPVEEDNRTLLSFDKIGGFSETENQTLINSIKFKEYLFTPESEIGRNMLLNIVDILFAYCYDIRLTDGDCNVESAANIVKLSNTLAWLESYDSNKQQDTLLHVIQGSMRRLICYGYLRVWKLGRKVLSDVTKILLLGKRTILKIFLQLYGLFEHTDTHYLLNKLYIHDCCNFIQQVSDRIFYTLGMEYNIAKTVFEKQENRSKDSMGWYLNEIETWVEEVQLKQEEEDDDEEAVAAPTAPAAAALEEQEIPNQYKDYLVFIQAHPKECDYLQSCLLPIIEEETGENEQANNGEEDDQKDKNSVQYVSQLLSHTTLNSTTTTTTTTAATTAITTTEEKKPDTTSPSIINKKVEDMPYIAKVHNAEEEEEEEYDGVMNGNIGLTAISTIRKANNEIHQLPSITNKTSTITDQQQQQQSKPRILIQEISTPAIITITTTEEEKEEGKANNSEVELNSGICLI